MDQIRPQYIYIRTQTSYDPYDACKLGHCDNIPNRESVYVTGEIIKGMFVLVVQILSGSTCQKIEKLMKNYFASLNLHVYEGAGTEFFRKEICELIIGYLDQLNITYKILTPQEITQLTRKKRKITARDFLHAMRRTIAQKGLILPLSYQRDIISQAIHFYESHDIGKLLWACGLGKSVVSLLIAKRLQSHSIVIGVPSIYLQTQFIEEIKKVYPSRPHILCVGSEKIDGIKTTTDKQTIIKFLQKHQGLTPVVVITTYASCDLLKDITPQFDFKIGDEAHHLVSVIKDSPHTYQTFHQIQSRKTLFMTATQKVIEHPKERVYSMDQEEYFGSILDQKSVCWAIQNKRITDYNLLVLKNTEAEVDEIIKKVGLNVINKELFLSSFMTLKAIETYYPKLTHVLLYVNSIANANLTQTYIEQILRSGLLTLDVLQFYHDALHSTCHKDFKHEIEMFTQHKYGIISCVYIFGEGVDVPQLNGVTFGENMESDIRIVQSALRPNRLDRDKPDKKAYIMIPFIDTTTTDITKECHSYDKCRQIIAKMGNVDETIESKMTLNTSISTEETEGTSATGKNSYELVENTDELMKLKLRLRRSKDLMSTLSPEQNEFNYVRHWNHILQLQSKEAYIVSREQREEDSFVIEPEKYFISNGVWTNWYDFLGLDTHQLIQTKHEWIAFCLEKNIKTPEEYDQLCLMYSQLPRNPADFYKGFLNIPQELNWVSHRRPLTSH